MDEEEQGQHAPTPVQLETARREGNITRSQWLSSSLQVLGMLVLMFLFVPMLGKRFCELIKNQWRLSTISTEQLDGGHLFWNAVSALQFPLLTMMGIMFLFAVISHVGQTGWMLTPSRVAPDWSRISPARWWQRIFSLSNATCLLQIPTLLVFLVAVGTALYCNLNQILYLGRLPVDQMITSLFGIVLNVGLIIAIILFVFGLFDYGIQWVAHQRRLRMSEQQLRDEIRMNESNPQIATARQSQYKKHARIGILIVLIDFQDTEGTRHWSRKSILKKIRNSAKIINEFESYLTIKHNEFTERSEHGQFRFRIEVIA